jgi:hypothetical protein
MQMDIKKAFIVLYFVVSILILPRLATAQDPRDWEYFPEKESNEVFAKKIIQIPCSSIDDLFRKRDKQGLYLAIRDAALFGDKTCETYIKKHLRRLKKLVGVKDAVAFYFYKNGDPSGLELLAKSYDKEAHLVGDHWTVDLFGFINEWEISGRRLVRHAKCCSDAVGGEALCNAITWRCKLYGKEDFKRHWFKIGEEEKVDPKLLQHFYQDCCE